MYKRTAFTLKTLAISTLVAISLDSASCALPSEPVYKYRIGKFHYKFESGYMAPGQSTFNSFETYEGLTAKLGTNRNWGILDEQEQSKYLQLTTARLRSSFIDDYISWHRKKFSKAPTSKRECLGYSRQWWLANTKDKKFEFVNNWCRDSCLDAFEVWRLERLIKIAAFNNLEPSPTDFAKEIDLLTVRRYNLYSSINSDLSDSEFSDSKHYDKLEQSINSCETAFTEHQKALLQ